MICLRHLPAVLLAFALVPTAAVAADPLATPVEAVNDFWNGAGFKDGAGKFHRADSSMISSLAVDAATSSLADSAWSMLQSGQRKQKPGMVGGLVVGMVGAGVVGASGIGLVPAILGGAACGVAGGGVGALVAVNASKREMAEAQRLMKGLAAGYNAAASGSVGSSPAEATSGSAPVTPADHVSGGKAAQSENASSEHASP